jgi:Transposase and inactivated derivatives
MMTKDGSANREQIEFLSIDQLVPEEHLVRKLENAINWNFIYELVEDKYSEDNGRPSVDPVTLIKLPVLQYMFGIRSMRRTIKEADVNMAYRWFLGLGIYDPVPHFSTFGKNYTRRFKGTDLFEQIFQRILSECFQAGMVDPSVVFVDSTHVKARANGKNYCDEIAGEQALWYEKELREEIQADRESHGKRPLKNLAVVNDEDDTPEENDDDETPPTESISKGKPNKNTSKKKVARRKQEKHIKKSTSDPESGWFRKGEHKHVFAYSVETVCEQNGVILGYSVHPGNENDGRTFPAVFDKVEDLPIELVVGDSAYKTPAIARLLSLKGVDLLSAYKRPQTKTGFFPRHEYVYDEFNDCYICPNNQVLSYHTTNRRGYREYCSNPEICAGCPHLKQCTESKNHLKTVTRHVWEEYMEQTEENRYIEGIREFYHLRKETIERDFGLAKELHSFRYTQMFGKARMEMKAALTYTCLNLKKLAKLRWHERQLILSNCSFFAGFSFFAAKLLNAAIGVIPLAALSTV